MVGTQGERGAAGERVGGGGVGRGFLLLMLHTPPCKAAAILGAARTGAAVDPVAPILGVHSFWPSERPDGIRGVLLGFSPPASKCPFDKNDMGMPMAEPNVRIDPIKEASVLTRGSIVLYKHGRSWMDFATSSLTEDTQQKMRSCL